MSEVMPLQDVRPRLPEVPATSRELDESNYPTQPIPVLQRLGARLSKELAGSPWKRLLAGAVNDQRELHYVTISIDRPDQQTPTLFDKQWLTATDFSYESAIVLRRLIQLIDRVVEVSAGELPEPAYINFPELIRACKPYLLWDAGLDLFLADRILEDRQRPLYRRPLGVRFDLKLPTIQPAEVDALRERVIYVINALQAVYDVVMRVQVASRLGSDQSMLQHYEEIVDWFRSYAEVLETTRKPANMKSSRWYRRNHR